MTVRALRSAVRIVELLTLLMCAMLLGAAPGSAVVVPPPTLSVTGLPSAADPTATVTATWNTGSGVPGELLLLPPGARHPSLAGYGNNGTQSYGNISYSGTYVFQLVTIGLHHRLLVTDTVRHGTVTPRLVALSWVPPRTGGFENRVIQLVPYLLGVLFIALALGYVRSLRPAAP